MMNESLLERLRHLPKVDAANLLAIAAAEAGVSPSAVFPDLREMNADRAGICWLHPGCKNHCGIHCAGSGYISEPVMQVDKIT